MSREGVLDLWCESLDGAPFAQSYLKSCVFVNTKVSVIITFASMKRRRITRVGLLGSMPRVAILGSMR
jgi:hypothetical protein